jgi:hypothetical protein
MTTIGGLSEQKRSYLEVLAIAHYVYAALIALIGVVMMLMMSIGVFGLAQGSSFTGELPFGGFELSFFAFAFILVFGYALCNALVGLWLKGRRRWMAIVVLSVINALNVPVGTLLGVFTVVVLAGDDVRGAFDRGGAAPAPVAPPAAAVREP